VHFAPNWSCGAPAAVFVPRGEGAASPFEFMIFMRRHFLLAVTTLISALSAAVCSAAADRRPNVILIMADDFGYEAVTANGGQSYKTPSLDRLAAGGMRFEHCHVQPLCTPTRVQLMTGIYNIRNYVDFQLMDPKVTTFGQLMKKAGYATAIAGTWQLGTDPEGPKKLGFDESVLWQLTRRPPRYANPGLEINGKEKDYDNGEYGPKLINDFALDFVTRHKGHPFFLYYPMLLTHSPFQPVPGTPAWDPKMSDRDGNDPKNFPAMVEFMDRNVGRVVAKL
jgi:arylsulfatase A